jgi:dienelactone hydrolase
MTVPTLILIGDRDDWTPADACRKMAAGESDIGVTRTKGAGDVVTLVVYPGATHAFDAVAPSRRYLGHFMEYDEAAAKDAEVRLRAFLHDTLTDATPASAVVPGAHPALH